MEDKDKTRYIARMTEFLTDMAKFVSESLKALRSILANIDINRHPNKHVVHLACYGKKPRTRKKNLNRIYKWLTKN